MEKNLYDWRIRIYIGLDISGEKTHREYRKKKPTAWAVLFGLFRWPAFLEQEIIVVYITI